MKLAILIVILNTLLLNAQAPGTTVATTPLRKDADGCSLLVPESLGTGSLRWIGSCAGGVAEGSGVVRVQVAAGDVRLFAGKMHEGRPVAGFVDEGPNVSQADAVGPVLHFRGATPLPIKGAAEALEACKIAAAGAHAAADRFRAAGNAASAKFYDDWVTSLHHCNGPE